MGKKRTQDKMMQYGSIKCHHIIMENGHRMGRPREAAEMASSIVA